MEQTKLDRINELARLAKERALTEEELRERDALRKAYIAAFRASAEAALSRIEIKNPDGTVEPLKKKD